jgi:hypothetical protein
MQEFSPNGAVAPFGFPVSAPNLKGGFTHVRASHRAGRDPRIGSGNRAPSADFLLPILGLEFGRRPDCT